jgi:hypothetical protein
MVKDWSSMPTGRGTQPSANPTGEPGRQHDHLSSAGEGPGQTPGEDILPGVLLVVFAALMIPSAALLLFADPPIAVVAVLVPLGVVFLVLGIWLIRRGSRRLAWRKANTHLTGGRYLGPWEKTPDSY